MDTVHDQMLVAIAMVVRGRRDELGMSQNDLAFRSGLNRSYIGDFERGGRSISVKNLSRLAQALEISVSSLVQLAESKLSAEGPLELKAKWVSAEK